MTNWHTIWDRAPHARITAVPYSPKQHRTIVMPIRITNVIPSHMGEVKISSMTQSLSPRSAQDLFGEIVVREEFGIDDDPEFVLKLGLEVEIVE
jgi:hypothetical protein